MSFTIKATNITDQHEIKIRLITGWVLGKGPCGSACTENDVGRDTSVTRKAMETTNNDTYFGQWLEEYNTTLVDYDITKIVMANMTETIIGVSVSAGWEQEMMETTFLLNTTKTELDIKYTGHSWRERTAQVDHNKPDGERWQVMITATLGVRLDTGEPNRSPKAFVKPYYRLKLGEVNRIHIAAFDGDDDYVKCKQSMYSEAMSLSKYPLPGLTVLDSCTVILNTSTALNYTDDFWGGIAVTLRDFPRHSTKIGTTKLLSRFSISDTPVQFLVQVLEFVEGPRFVQPTLENNHEFTIYVGVVWSVNIYALAVENTTIHEFRSFGFQNENISESTMKDDDLDRERVKQIEVFWKPGNNDVGRHIFCTRALDSTGVDSSEDKCYIVVVKEMATTFNSSTIGQGKPFFFNLPSASENVTCKVDTTCVLPLFVNASSKVDSVQVTTTTIDKAYFNSIVTRETNVYQTDMFIRHSGYGIQIICVLATDINGMSSEEVCISFDIDPPDPCYSSPCQNSGECKRRPLDKSDYQCINCPSGFSGKNCENKDATFCDSNPCVHGRCSNKYNKCYCILSGKGYTSPTCAINKDDCDGITCNNHGICKDQLDDYTCQCFSRYSGHDCEIDRCRSEPPGAETCPGDIPGCTSTTCQNGVCIGNGKCVCQLGYRRDAQCSQAVGDIQALYRNVTILPPTMEPRSTTVCYKDEPCHLDIYFTTPNSGTTLVNVYKITEALKGMYTIGSNTPWLKAGRLTGMFKVSIGLTINDTLKGYICLVVFDSTTTANDNRCFALKVTENPINTPGSLENKQRNRLVKFVHPTLLPESTIVCRKDTPCYILLYTSLNSGSCDKPISTDPEVTILDVKTGTTKCRTQAGILLNTPGNRHVCVQSTKEGSDSQKRCFFVQAYDQDPCANSLCQNRAECFYSDDILGNTTCECPLKYEGAYCENGPCQSADNHCHQGYCEVHNHVTQCMCPIGYKGSLCDENFPDGIADLTNTGARFTDVALPSTVTCIRNRPCSVPLIASGHYSGADKPDIRPGYTSTAVNIDGVETYLIANGSYAVNVKLYGRRVGAYDVCLLSMNKLGANRDELCFKVKVTEETSTIYSDKDTPHFIETSVPPNSELVCKVDTPCHLLFNVSPGDQYVSTECVTLGITATTPVKYHVYSSCDACIIGSSDQQACHIDVVFYVQTGVDVCIDARTTLTNVVGEKRCYKLTSVSSEVKKGCQMLSCENGGFCDGHVEPAKCHCPIGYSGSTCQIDESTQSPSGTSQQLTGGSALPTDVMCYVNKPCLIPHNTLDSSLNMTTGYVSPGVKVNHSTSMPGTANGDIQIVSMSSGKKTVCLQEKQASSIEDEVCMTVNFAANGGPSTDQARPYFVAPTYPKDTTVMCNANSTCHLDIHYSKGSVFNSTQACPTLSETSSPPVNGIYIFPGTPNPSDCNSDISYISPNINTDTKERLCVEVSLPGKRGEERCFILQIVRKITDKVRRPCAGMTCQNEAVCIADLTVNPPVGNCICRNGYRGMDCSQATNVTNSLPGYVDAGSNNISPQPGQTPYFDPTGGIPSNIACVENQPCTIQIPYRGAASKPPLPGYHASSVNITGTSVIPLPTSGLHVATYTVNSTQTGVHRTCLQTTVDGVVGGVNLDEICFNVTVSGSSSSSPNPIGSPFENTSYTNGTTMNCPADVMCQLSIVTKANPTCIDIQECGNGLPATHVFDTHQEGTSCITNVAIKTGQANTVQDLCLSAGSSGEQRHIQVEVANKTEYGPCQKLHCRNGGFCNGRDAIPVCECTRTYTGIECEIDPCTTALPIIKRGSFINGSARVADGKKVMFACGPGYELANPSIDYVVCDARSNTWTGLFPSCTAKVICFNDTDCLNNGTCNSGTCSCQPGFKHTNCDEGQCNGEAAIAAKSRAETKVKEGRVSCFCTVKGSNNVEKKVQIIKRRPKMPTSHILKHAGYGAGGISGTFVLGFILYYVIKKLKKPSTATGGTPKRDTVNRIHTTPQWYME